MPITVASNIVPRNSGTFGILEDKYLIGGFRVVADAAARTAIPSGSRRAGMFVYMLSDATIYKLGIDLLTWSVVPVKGDKGDTGNTGATGATGGVGATGPQGIQGPRGFVGADGAPGPTGPQGPAGPTGPQGIQGPQGPTGPQGIQGIPAVWLVATSQPANNVGTDSDMALNSTNGDVYKKTSGTWAYQGNIRGIQGVQGIPGVQGQQGIQGLPGNDGATGPKGDTGDMGATGLQGQQGIQGEVGPVGPQGEASSWLVGSGVPSELSGTILDLFLDTTTNDVYEKSSGTWAFLCNIKGAKGDTGDTGAIGPQGIQGPQGDGLVYVGDWVATTYNPNEYVSAEGSVALTTSFWVVKATAPYVSAVQPKDDAANWVEISAITGPQGAIGPQGLPGIDGVDGLDGAASKWLTGSGVPSTAIGNVDDMYIDVTSDAVYQKVDASTWVFVVNLKGLPGDTGAQGLAGTNGIDGRTVLNGTSDPANALGQDGDFYINTTSFEIFGPKATGAWPAGVALRGPQGVQGIQGVIGLTGPQGDAGPQGPAGSDGTNGTASVWRNGNGAPAVGLGNDTDFYLDNLTGDAWYKSAGTWSNVTNITGPAGANYDPDTTVLNLPYDIGLFISGLMSATSTVVGSFLATRTVSLKANLPGSLARAKVAPSNSVVYNITVDGVIKGQVTFNTGSTVGTFSWATGLNVTAGQLIEIVTPSTLEASIKDVSITLVGIAQAPNGVMLP